MTHGERGRFVLARKAVRRHQQVERRIGRRPGSSASSRSDPVRASPSGRRVELVLVATAAGRRIGLTSFGRVDGFAEVALDAAMARGHAKPLVASGVVELLTGAGSRSSPTQRNFAGLAAPVADLGAAADLAGGLPDCAHAVGVSRQWSPMQLPATHAQERRFLLMFPRNDLKRIGVKCA